jgi:hypothetical protein
MVASAPILATRAGLPVYIPPPLPKVVVRPRLIERLKERVRVSAGGTVLGLVKDQLQVLSGKLNAMFRV